MYDFLLDNPQSASDLICFSNFYLDRRGRPHRRHKQRKDHKNDQGEPYHWHHVRPLKEPTRKPEVLQWNRNRPRCRIDPRDTVAEHTGRQRVEKWPSSRDSGRSSWGMPPNGTLRDTLISRCSTCPVNNHDMMINGTWSFGSLLDSFSHSDCIQVSIITKRTNKRTKKTSGWKMLSYCVITVKIWLRYDLIQPPPPFHEVQYRQSLVKFILRNSKTKK